MEQIISIYNFEGIWLFDDYEKDVLGEPFVEGSSEHLLNLGSFAWCMFSQTKF